MAGANDKELGWSNIQRFAMLKPQLLGEQYEASLVEEVVKIVDFLQEVAELDGLDQISPLANPIEFWDNVLGDNLNMQLVGLNYSDTVEVENKSEVEGIEMLLNLTEEEQKLLSKNNMRLDQVQDGGLNEKGLFNNTNNQDFGYFIVPKVLPNE